MDPDFSKPAPPDVAGGPVPPASPKGPSYVPDVPLAAPPKDPTDPTGESSLEQQVSEEMREEPPAPMTQNEVVLKAEHDGLKNIISTIVIFVAAPIIALLLITFIFQSYEVDGPSMELTLRNHDRLIVLKTSRTWSKITGKPFIPNRGDIIVFNRPGVVDIGHSGEKQLIKRVIGLPGERVVVQDGTVTVYNKEHPDGFNPDVTTGYHLTVSSTPGSADVTVPANEVFVSGDNRLNSLDSRTFGPVPAKDIVGKLALRVYPFESAKQF